ncbi:Membrane-associated guanylate kinase, WW and PDZ domain-containing protein 3 [Liparis tanakae]|uniref:Membrane-associated guanylate kinase, WW and PDZ domain-containing protein 3 n=1 Tax=Liparis tanakae TaxID=230148 RepID=A0A4Z2E617_9TELE|nr:Membrane-associated guanylate kinase, WW and PDZ domain-containing protein 3 [Liparis tanakae]
MSQGLSQPSPQQSPHPAPQLTPHPGSHPAPHVTPHPASHPAPHVTPHPASQEMITSPEALAQPGLAPNQHPFPPSALRSSSPKPDASELYIKSRALLDSKPPNTKDLDVFIKRNQESGFGFRVLGGEGPDQPVGFSPARSRCSQPGTSMSQLQSVN